MGHFDFVCEICHVDMSIGRIRRPDEPHSAAWRHDGREFVGCYAKDRSGYFHDRNAPACPSSCTTVPRIETTKPAEWPEYSRRQDAKDPDWEMPDAGADADEDEPLEWDEDEDEQMDETPDYLVNAEDDAGKEGAMPLREIYKPERAGLLPDGTWHNGLLYMQGFPNRGNRYNDMNSFYYKTRRGPEHVAGLECHDREGYSGHRLSLAEMKNCRNWRCVIPKPAGWTPEVDDRLFEENSTFILSGQGNGSPDAEEHFVHPPRHGLADPGDVMNALTSSLNPRGQSRVPAHTWCIDMYGRAAMQRHGKTDLEGIWLFRHVERHWRRSMEIERMDYDDAVRECEWPTDEPWKHNPGTEWLVANPVELPGLREALDICQQPAQPAQRPAPTRETNVLAALPTELLELILDMLDAPALGAMHNTSAAFRGYTQRFFREQVHACPYKLWELDEGAYPQSPDRPVVWDSLCPSWLMPEAWPSGVPYEEEERDQWRFILAEQPELEEAKGAAMAVNEAIRRAYDDRRRALFARVRREELEHRENVSAWVAGQTSPALGEQTTNWHTAWRLIVRGGDGEREVPKGLRNRTRVWKCVQQMLDRIERYRPMNFNIYE